MEGGELSEFLFNEKIFTRRIVENRKTIKVDRGTYCGKIPLSINNKMNFENIFSSDI
jgi:hypothetical protein